MTPTQDITLGCYYLTAMPRDPAPGKKGKRLTLFGSREEVLFAHTDGAVRKHQWIQLANPDFNRETVYGNANRDWPPGARIWGSMSWNGTNLRTDGSVIGR